MPLLYPFYGMLSNQYIVPMLWGKLFEGEEEANNRINARELIQWLLAMRSFFLILYKIKRQ